MHNFSMTPMATPGQGVPNMSAVTTPASQQKNPTLPQHSMIAIPGMPMNNPFPSQSQPHNMIHPIMAFPLTSSLPTPGGATHNLFNKSTVTLPAMPSTTTSSARPTPASTLPLGGIHPVGVLPINTQTTLINNPQQPGQQLQQLPPPPALILQQQQQQVQPFPSAPEPSAPPVKKHPRRSTRHAEPLPPTEARPRTRSATLASAPEEQEVELEAMDDRKNQSYSCHQCKTRRDASNLVGCNALAVLPAGSRLSPKCIKLYCGTCLLKYYQLTLEQVNNDPNWECPFCRGNCCCSGCKKVRDREEIMRQRRAQLIEEGIIQEDDTTPLQQLYVAHGGEDWSKKGKKAAKKTIKRTPRASKTGDDVSIPRKSREKSLTTEPPRTRTSLRLNQDQTETNAGGEIEYQLLPASIPRGRRQSKKLEENNDIENFDESTTITTSTRSGKPAAIKKPTARANKKKVEETTTTSTVLSLEPLIEDLTSSQLLNLSTSAPSFPQISTFPPMQTGIDLFQPMVPQNQSNYNFMSTGGLFSGSNNPLHATPNAGSSGQPFTLTVGNPPFGMTTPQSNQNLNQNYNLYSQPQGGLYAPPLSAQAGGLSNNVNPGIVAPLSNKPQLNVPHVTSILSPALSYAQPQTTTLQLSTSSSSAGKSAIPMPLSLATNTSESSGNGTVRKQPAPLSARSQVDYTQPRPTKQQKSNNGLPIENNMNQQ